MPIYELRFEILSLRNTKITNGIIYVGVDNDEDINSLISYANNSNNGVITTILNSKVRDIERKMLSVIGETHNNRFLVYSLPLEVIGIDPTKVPDYVIPPK